MLKALLIADQQRLHALVAASLGGSGVQLTIISSLANGIEQAVATSPDLLFVQGRLSGLSIEIVSRHVASHVDQQRTKPIIFVDPGEDPEALPATQLCLDLALPDSALESRIASIVKAAQPSPVGTPAASPAAASPADEFIPDAPSPPLRTDPEAPAVAPQESTPADAATAPPAGGGIATRFEAELDTELARRAETPILPPAAEEPKPAAAGQARVGQAEAAELAARSRRRIVAAVAGTVLFVAVAAMTTFLPTGRTPAPVKGPTAAKPTPSATLGHSSSAKPPTPVQQAGSPPATTLPPSTAAAKPAEPLREPLPSFVPAGGRDPAYAATNPGWERYQDAKLEYKVFWEGGKLMAIQVIDRTGAGLSTAFFTKSMQELAGVRDYRLTSKEVKDNHLVKKGSLGAAGSIIIYKNKADSVLQAFVIHFEQDRNRRR